MISRRRFIRTLASGLAVAVTPTIFLPPRGGWIQSAHGGYLINTDHPLVGVSQFEKTDIDWMLKTIWDAYRIEPSHLIVTMDELSAAEISAREREAWHTLASVVIS